MHDLIINVLEELGLSWRNIGDRFIIHGDYGTLELIPLDMVGRSMIAYATDEHGHIGTKSLQCMSGNEHRDRKAIADIVSNINGKNTYYAC